jgi:hypothetical protein
MHTRPRADRETAPVDTAAHADTCNPNQFNRIYDAERA